MKVTATVLSVGLVLASLASAQEASPAEVQDAPPQVETTPGYPQEGQPPQQLECRQIKKGGPIAGIVIASVFWYVLPMSIPVWITQAKKLKRRKKEIHEQQLRGCP
jgi:hypothetical protein